MLRRRTASASPRRTSACGSPCSTRSRPWPICRIAARRPSLILAPSRADVAAQTDASDGALARADALVDALERSARAARSLERRLAALARARARTMFDAMEFGFLFDPGAAAPLDRLPGRRGQSRSQLLRPARLRGAPGELRRDRQGRRAGAALVPARARPDAGRPRLGADLVVGIDVRVPDAVAGDARAGGQPAGADQPPGRPPADRVRRRARRALGRLGIGVQRARSGAHLSVLELRRSRPGPQARAQRGRRRRALRDGAGGDGGSAGRGAATSRVWPRPAAAAATAATRRSTTRRRACPKASRSRSSAPTWRIIRG